MAFLLDAHHCSRCHRVFRIDVLEIGEGGILVEQDGEQRKALLRAIG